MFDKWVKMPIPLDFKVYVFNVTNPDEAALLTILDMMPSLVPMVNKALEQFFPNLTDPFMRVRVKDLFFDGIFLSCDGDSAALGHIVSYKDKKAMAMWGDEYCSMLNGSDSSVFPPIDESN
ncbi:Sensory neuron membrane protein 2, partial [Operophtera brumata]